ncbi:uncharacterized protein LOC143028570 isoform X9 [Oratosquilla oratoria]|uniref:uncharacterized protein LOC143028570 isoform X9 n=1 Tax=Oratosquilla oratoria TaxID=337810 RepID=UPI003F75D9EE
MGLPNLKVTMSAKGSGMTAKETFQTLMEMSKLLNTGAPDHKAQLVSSSDNHAYG